MNPVLIIVPTYNERDNLPQLIKCINAQSAEADVLVVDDNSPDGTGRLADEIAAVNPTVNVLHRQEKNGLGRAYIAGFQWALERHYEFIFEMDGDFSHNPADVPAFLEVAKNADLVIGSRYWNGIRVINWPLNRLVLSLGAAQYVKIITGMPFTDPTGGYKCFRRSALQAVDLDGVRSNGYSFQGDDAQDLAPGPARRRGADHLHRPVPRHFQDVAQDRLGSAGHGLAAVVPERAAPESAQESLTN